MTTLSLRVVLAAAAVAGPAAPLAAHSAVDNPSAHPAASLSIHRSLLADDSSAPATGPDGSPRLGMPADPSAVSPGSLSIRPIGLSRAVSQDAHQPAAPEAGALDGGSNPWRASFNSWVWMLGVEGDIGVRGRTADVSADFGDILEVSDSVLAFSGRLEIGYGRLGVFVDGLYSKLGADDQSGPLGIAEIDVEFEMALIDFGLMYRIAEWEPTGGGAANSMNASLDLYAGGRYTNLEIELDPANLPTFDQSRDWLDPIVGAKVVLPFAERWHIMANGDVGGFGVESDFTWSATAVLGYSFSLFDHPASVFFGYRAIGQDYSDGDGNEEFTWDAVNHGPMLGFSFLF